MSLDYFILFLILHPNFDDCILFCENVFHFNKCIFMPTMYFPTAQKKIIYIHMCVCISTHTYIEKIQKRNYISKTSFHLYMKKIIK